MLDCNNNNQSIDTLVAALAVLSTGNVTNLRAVEVDTTNSMDYFDCNVPAETAGFDQIFRLLIGLDDDSNPALRVGFTSNCPTSAAQCGQQGLTGLDWLRRSIGKTDDGKPFLRICLQPLE